jgi:hypothetical protein
VTNQIIYAVVEDSYEDRTFALYSTEEDANALAERHNRALGDGRFFVHPWELDTVPVPEPGPIAYFVSYTGAPDNSWFVSGSPDATELKYPEADRIEGSMRIMPEAWCVEVWAETREEAAANAYPLISAVAAADGVSVSEPEPGGF